jgi:hypothetical protein
MHVRKKNKKCMLDFSSIFSDMHFEGTNVADIIIPEECPKFRVLKYIQPSEYRQHFLPKALN